MDTIGGSIRRLVSAFSSRLSTDYCRTHFRKANNKTIILPNVQGLLFTHNIFSENTFPTLSTTDSCLSSTTCRTLTGHYGGYSLNTCWAPGYCDQNIHVSCVLCNSLTEFAEVPGTGAKVVQNLQKFWVRFQKTELTKFPGNNVARAYRTSLTEVPGGYKSVVSVPRVLSYGRIAPTKVPDVVARACRRSYSSSECGHECRAELTKVLCRFMPGKLRRV